MFYVLAHHKDLYIAACIETKHSPIASIDTDWIKTPGVGLIAFATCDGLNILIFDCLKQMHASTRPMIWQFSQKHLNYTKNALSHCIVFNKKAFSA